MPLEIIREDILKLKVDVIVNPSNTHLTMGHQFSVSGQIFKAAGIEALNQECRKFAPIHEGDAILTSGYNLAIPNIIHVAGPHWIDGQHEESLRLAMCYRNAFNIVKQNGFKTIAFPLMSSGTYNYPKDKALQIALNEINDFVLKNEVLVYLVVYDKTAYQLSTRLTNSVKDYIDTHITIEPIQSNNLSNRTIKAVHKPIEATDLKDLIQQKDESFSESLFRIIKNKHLNDVDVYKKSNISKAVFSKIRSHKDYRPQKTTALAFCIGLQLNDQESNALLSKAGYTFSKASVLDLIVLYFIQKQNYDIHMINIVLYDNDQSLLGSTLD